MLTPGARGRPGWRACLQGEGDKRSADDGDHRRRTKGLGDRLAPGDNMPSLIPVLPKPLSVAAPRSVAQNRARFNLSSQSLPLHSSGNMLPPRLLRHARAAAAPLVLKQPRLTVCTTQSNPPPLAAPRWNPRAARSGRGVVSPPANSARLRASSRDTGDVRRASAL